MIFHERDEWSYFKKCFQLICEDVECFRLETKEEALADTYLVDDPDVGPGFMYKHEGVIPFRKTENRDQLEQQFETARALIPKVRAAIEARELTPEFARAWGGLNYAVGHVMCAWFARDKDDLGSERGSRKSAEVRDATRHRCLVASYLLPLLEQGMTRKKAEKIFEKKVHAAISKGEAMSPLTVEELKALLTKEGHLRPGYGERKLRKKDMKALLTGGHS